MVKVPPPNGVDDTANIQAALDACAASGNECTVQLAAGTYHTSQLVEYNFHGTFRGMGKERTTIEALPNLTVNIPDVASEGECLPDTSSCLWPSLIIFVDGNIHVSDLAIHVTAAPGTATIGWIINGNEVIGLLDALRFMGKNPTYVAIDRVGIEGQPDNSATSLGVVLGFGAGFNVLNGIIFAGELPRSSTPFDYYFLSGSLSVRNSSFNTLFDGVSQDGFLQSSRITIGGTRGAGNHFENVYVGMDLESSQSSVFNISHNVSAGNYSGLWVIPWQSVFVPTSSSLYFIHDNHFTATGANAEVLYFNDDPANPWIKAAAWENTVAAQQPLSEGIGVYYTQGTLLWNNTVTGTGGYDAIGLWSSSQDHVIDNNVSGFAFDPTVGYAQIYLDPGTSNDYIACHSSDVVLDQGSNNTVKCSAAAAPMTNPRSAVPLPNVLNRKPR